MMDIPQFISALVVILLSNFAINLWHNKDSKNKDLESISLYSTTIQSLLSAILAVILLYVVFTFLLKPHGDSL